MLFSAKTIALLVAALAVAASGDNTSGVCTPADQRCAGADGKSFVQFYPCCDPELSCVEKVNATADEWGRYCLRPMDSGQCHATGQRCMGAEGYPHVQYLKCCDSFDECVVDSSLGWGSFCKPMHPRRPTPASSQATSMTYYGASQALHASSTAFQTQFTSHSLSYDGSAPNGATSDQATSKTNAPESIPVHGGDLAGAYFYVASPSIEQPTTACTQHGTTIPAPVVFNTYQPTTTPEYTFPPGSPFCAAQKNDKPALGNIILSPETIQTNSRESAIIEIRITRTPCGETNISAASLTQRDALALESSVCSLAETTAGAPPLVCRISNITDGSIRITIAIRFSPDIAFEFDPLLALLQIELRRLFGFSSIVTKRTDTQITSGPPTTSFQTSFTTNLATTSGPEVISTTSADVTTTASLNIFTSAPATAAAAFVQQILDVHNQYRTAVSNPPLKWSTALSSDAATWANILASSPTLQLAHSGTEGQGENLWGGTAGAFSSSEMVQTWADEGAYFEPGTFNSITGSGGHIVGHYTQIIWQTTSEIGCATASGSGNSYLVCRYTPPGNIIGMRVP
jgi:uncharacterized protein YkwD